MKKKQRELESMGQNGAKEVNPPPSKAMIEADHIITTEVDKNKEDLKFASIEPLSPEYLYSTNGVYLLCGKMGSGKTYWIMKHLLIMDQMFDKPYYDQILFTSTSDGLDKTVQTIEPKLKEKPKFIKDTEILQYLTKLMRRKMKFYALTQYIRYHRINHEMEKLIKDKKLYDWNKDRTKYVPSPRKIATYFAHKMEKWAEIFHGYPSNTLLILDDFASHPLIRTPDTPLNRLFTKVRHYNLTVILSVQSWRFVCLNFKRIATDMNIYQGYSFEDFFKMIKQTPSGLEPEPLWLEYRNLPDPHNKLVVNITAHAYHFE
jgi:hypothetical protein